MKNFLLYFFALLFCVTLLPTVAHAYLARADTEEATTIHLLQHTTDTVKTVALEDYVIGVMSAAGYSYAPEAMQAIAVCIRSDALYCEQNRPTHPQAAVCDDPDCCAPFREDAFSEDAVRAAADSLGVFLQYDGKPIPAMMHESSGAYTESSLSCYGVSLPYLTEVKNISENVRFTNSWETDAFLSRLGFTEACDVRELLIGTDASERVVQIRCGNCCISGTEAAKRLSIPSTCFTVEPTENGVTVVCDGKGDGVGLSRNGADLLARDGKTFREILAFYFPHTETAMCK